LPMRGLPQTLLSSSCTGPSGGWGRFSQTSFAEHCQLSRCDRALETANIRRVVPRTRGCEKRCTGSRFLSKCTNTGSLAGEQQLVLQWPASSIRDCDEIIQVEMHS
jgi:hypothetical protein